MNKHSLIFILFLSLLAACAPPQLASRENCRYAQTPGREEFVFTLPSFSAYNRGEGERLFFTAPRRDAPLRLWSWDYTGHFLDHRGKNIATVEGDDASYSEWLLDDCRLLYTPTATTP